MMQAVIGRRRAEEDPDDIENKVDEMNFKQGEKPNYKQITDDLIERVRDGDEKLMRVM